MSDPVNLPAVQLVGVNVEALLAKAVDAKAAVEVLERLMVMRRELAAEAAKAAFDRSLAAFQAECPVIVKSEAVNERNSNEVRYRYAPLDVIVSQVKALLEKHGLSHTETAKVETEWVTAVCTVKHCAGHSEQSEFKVPIDPKAFMNAAQKFASALTFAKRYAFCNAFGILTGDSDDDGRNAHPSPENAAGRPQRPNPPPNAPQKAQTSAAPPSRPAQAPSDKPLQASKPKCGGPKARDWMIEKLQARPGEPGHNLTTDYFRAIGALLPNEELSSVPFRFVAVDMDEIKALRSRLAEFERGERAEPAFAPHEEPERPAAKAKAEAKSATDEAWKSFPMPWGKQAGVLLGALDKPYLFGLWANYQVETEFKGKPKKPETIAKDRTFRAMLDLAGAHHGFAEKKQPHEEDQAQAEAEAAGAREEENDSVPF